MRGPRTLTFEDRVAAQRAIEEVYWRHRTWPKDNPTEKPPLEAVMPESMLRARVASYLGQSNALENWWQRPITGEQLQAELDRMVRNTRDPQVLQELIDALGGDAFLIAETLARPALASRLIRSWYARDERFHGELRRRVESDLMRAFETGDFEGTRGRYAEQEWRRVSDTTAQEPAQDALILEPEEWAALQEDLETRSFPRSIASSIHESEESFFAIEVLDQGSDCVRTSTVSWQKLPFETWWALNGQECPLEVPTLATTFSLSTPREVACTEDTWSAIASGAPDPRQGHTAVWTGSEMIVWGGYNGGYLQSGARYTPATDSWVAMISNAPGTPEGRWGHTAVWTGTEMIVWGGTARLGDVVAGGRYNPASDTWSPMSTTNSPEPRRFHTMVWTGTETIVWGGYGGTSCCSEQDTGGRYDPATDTWRATRTTGAPSPRYWHTGVWTGSKMIVWGGYTYSTQPSTGGVYDPVSNTWTPTGRGANVPAQRQRHVAVWMGTQMIVWGGQVSGSAELQLTGGRYDPQTDTWTSTSTGANVPAGRRETPTAVWTGHEMILWGGFSAAAGWMNSGARYDPVKDAWTPTGTGPGTPSPRYSHTAVWTGEEMIVWGGSSTEGYANTGGRYSPASDTWTPTSIGLVASARAAHRAVWTGAEMLVWGGTGPIGYLNMGGRYNLAIDDWLSMAPTPEALSIRNSHTAVWTGTEMIVWGGANDSGPLYTGGRYDPTQDTWKATSVSDLAPAARRAHTAVWTGREMIVWGGYGVGILSTGERYDPRTDTWTPMSGTNAPQSRGFHTAVYVGGRMIVWGGSMTSAVNTGGIYDPIRDTWTPTSTGPGVPTARSSHTAVAADGGMIVWGGYGGPIMNSGGRFDLATNSWLPTSTSAGVPAPRYYHVSVWTGTEMIIWGGRDFWSRTLDDGARYDPQTDTWTPMSRGVNLPQVRELATAVWTGSEMIVWGGSPWTSTGGRYCSPGCIVSTWYPDSDGDGYGDAARPFVSCTRPAGDLNVGEDCDDADPAVHPAALEACNGIDDDCNGRVDEDDVAEDSDGDLVHNLCDNCPLSYNPSQGDTDPNGVGDACDLNDGLIWEWRDDKSSVSWQPEQGPTSWNLYIGDLGVLKSTGVYTQVPGSNPLATRDCGETSTLASDPASPATGKVSFSLVAGVTNGIEGTLGASTSGSRPNANPCP